MLLLHCPGRPWSPRKRWPRLSAHCHYRRPAFRSSFYWAKALPVSSDIHHFRTCYRCNAVKQPGIPDLRSHSQAWRKSNRNVRTDFPANCRVLFISFIQLLTTDLYSLLLSWAAYNLQAFFLIISIYNNKLLSTYKNPVSQIATKWRVSRCPEIIRRILISESYLFLIIYLFSLIVPGHVCAKYLSTVTTHQR